MKLFLLVLSILALTSCGPRRSGWVGADGKAGYSLVVDVVPMTMGVFPEPTVSCNRTDIFQDKDRDNVYSSGDTYQNGFLTCNGAVGVNGTNGTNGVDGQDGSDGSDGADGQDGQDGLDGVDGQDGSDGADGQNGTNGTNGLNANTTYQIVSIVDPCGPQHPSGFDEVILKLGNGSYLSSFSDNAAGLNTRFGVLPNGSYRTTDGTNCNFSLPIL